VNGVNLIDFTMPSAVPSPAGGKVTRVGGMKLVLPKKAEAEGKKVGQQEKKVNWKAILVLLFAWVMLFKLATWYARRYGK